MDQYVSKEVKTLNELYKEGKGGDHQRFADELEKIAKEHPTQLKSVVEAMRKSDKADQNLPAVDILMSNGKISSIDLDSKDAHGKLTGQRAETYHVEGKFVLENKAAAEQRKDQLKENYLPQTELVKEEKKHLAEAYEKANKGELKWETINGKTFPLNPGFGNPTDAQYPGNPADNGFRADWENSGRKLAQQRYEHWLQHNESVFESAQDTLEKIQQGKRI
jgi:hypothetical protein